jgi:hypothetical protein
VIVDENHLTTAEFENAKIAETIATRGDKSCRPNGAELDPFAASLSPEIST